MKTTNDIPGASKNNPHTGVKAPTKNTRKQVTPLVVSDPVPVVGSTDGPLSPARTAVRAAALLVAQALATVQPYVRVIPAADVRRVGRVPAHGLAAIPLMADVLRARPDVAPGVSPDALVEDVALAADLGSLAGRLGSLQTEVDHTSRLTLGDAWTGTRDAYAGAQRKALKDPGLATRIDPVRQVLRKGPLVDSTRRRADAQQQRLTRAQQRAATAQHRANLAQQRADMAKQAETLAAAAHVPAAATPAPAPAPAPGTPAR